VGVNLSALVTPQNRTLPDFSGKAIAIDAFNTLYQFLAIIRQPDGTPLMDSQGRVTSHLSGIIYRLTGFMEAGIRPVLVFDGRPPPRKARTVAARGEVKQRAEREWQRALEEGDIPKARTKAMQTSRLTGEMVQQARDLLEALGIPVVSAPSEGEAEAAFLAANGTVFAAGSQDYDSLLFGAPILVKNLALTGRRKLPNKMVFIDVQPEEIHLADVLAGLAVTREQLVDMALLMGTDFNEGVQGIGPKKSLALIRKHGSLAPALASLNVTIEGADEVRGIFLEPDVRPAEVQWRPPSREKVLDILVTQHQFSEPRVESALKKLGDVPPESQTSLDKWF